MDGIFVSAFVSAFVWANLRDWVAGCFDQEMVTILSMSFYLSNESANLVVAQERLHYTYSPII